MPIAGAESPPPVPAPVPRVARSDLLAASPQQLASPQFESPSPSQAAADELHPAIEAMRDTMRLAFANHALPGPVGPNGPSPNACHPGSLLAMLSGTLKSLSDRSPRAATDACEVLANYANELGAAALLRTAEDLVDDGNGPGTGGTRRVSINAANVLEWLEAARGAYR